MGRLLRGAYYEPNSRKCWFCEKGREDLGVIWSREKDCKGAENPVGFDFSGHVHTMLTLRPLSWVLTGSHWIAPPPSVRRVPRARSVRQCGCPLSVRAAGVAEQTARRVLRSRGPGEAAGAAFLSPPPRPSHCSGLSGLRSCGRVRRKVKSKSIHDNPKVAIITFT